MQKREEWLEHSSPRFVQTQFHSQFWIFISMHITSAGQRSASPQANKAEIHAERLLMVQATTEVCSSMACIVPRQCSLSHPPCVDAPELPTPTSVDCLLFYKSPAWSEPSYYNKYNMNNYVQYKKQKEYKNKSGCILSI